MGTIPASQIVQVTPNVLNAGGNALVLNGVILSGSTRVPLGTVASFPTAAAVAAFFGPTSVEAAIAAIYFQGFTNSNDLPGSILFAQFSQDASAAYLRGANISGLTLTQLQALTGSLNVTVDGYARAAASVVLSSATSFSNAASLIQTALNASLPALGTSTASTIATTTTTFTGSIAANVLTVTTAPSNPLVAGTILTGTGVTAGTQVQNQLTGTAGGIGTYAVSISQTVASESLSGTYGTMTIGGTVAGSPYAVGQTITGGTVSAGTQITALGTGTGGAGTYFVSPSQTVASAALDSEGTPVAVTYDSVSGGFVITSGIAGAASSIGFATGTIAAGLLLTQATGAVTSQGAGGQVPGPFMTALAALTQNWATFMLAFDPDGGAGNGQKLLFAQWTSQQNSRYAFICWDTDQSPTVTVPATTSLGYLIAQNNYAGTCLIDVLGTAGPVAGNTYQVAAFICGATAAIDFTETNGRITYAFKNVAGLVADVSNPTVASNLIANGYNFYGVYATANQQFTWFYPGAVSGQFLWLDSYINQIWLNNAFQLALMELLGNNKSVPYNPQGYSLIDAACMDPINQGANFGAFRPGVPLSSAQAAEVNAAAGANIAPTLSTRGWYLQVLPATPQVREARGSPPTTFWYMDGQSVQKINLTSVDVL
jgi:hypothetical protein